MPRHLKDWVDSYLGYTFNSEPRETFREWVAISTIASVLQRKCYFNLGVLTFYPNMYIVLVGPPASRKGTAMRPGRMFLDKLGIKLAADESSRQKLVKRLMECVAIDQDPDTAMPHIHSSLTIVSTELTVFLGYNDIELLTILNKWFDCENRFEYDTIGRGKEEVANVWVNLIGATTPSLLQSSMPQDAVGSGFASRTVFVFEEDKANIIIIPGLTKEQEETEELLLQDLAKIKILKGQFKLAKETAEEFIKVYTIWREETETNPPFSEPRLQTYLQRRQVHLWKLCMIYSASRSDELLIRIEDFKRASNMLRRTEKKMPNVYLGLGSNPLAKIQIQVMKIVAEKKVVDLQELYDKFYNDINSTQMGEILATLHKMGFAAVEIEGKRHEIRYLR